MKSIPIMKIPKEKVLDAFPLSESMLSGYLKSRPDILDNTDIFFENCRSKDETNKDFSLFKECDFHEYETVYICPIYLELYEYANMPVLEVIEHACAWCYPNFVVFQWNHDTDFASKYLGAEKYINARIINFNTSKPLPNDILAPFWTINTEYIAEKREYFAGFIGSPNNGLRKTLANTIAGKDGYIHTNLPYLEFLKTSAQCTFSLCPRGQGLSSYRFYECMHLSTIPVLFADKAALPYDIDYDEICIRIPESKINDFDFINNLLKQVDVDMMLTRKSFIREKFTLLGIQQEIHRRLS